MQHARLSEKPGGRVIQEGLEFRRFRDAWTGLCRCWRTGSNPLRADCSFPRSGPLVPHFRTAAPTKRSRARRLAKVTRKPCITRKGKRMKSGVGGWQISWAAVMVHTRLKSLKEPADRIQAFIKEYTDTDSIFRKASRKWLQTSYLRIGISSGNPQFSEVRVAKCCPARVRRHGAIGCHLGCRKPITLTAGGFPSFAAILLPSVNQRTIRSVDDRNLSMQRNVLER